MSMFLSAACAAAGQSSSAVPTSSSSLPTVLPVKPKETNAVAPLATRKPSAPVRRAAAKRPRTALRQNDHMVPSTPRPPAADSKRAVQPPDHIVVVIFENKHR